MSEHWEAPACVTEAGHSHVYLIQIHMGRFFKRITGKKKKNFNLIALF